MRKFLLLLFFASAAQAQLSPYSQSIPGLFTFATLPAAASYNGFTAYTTDDGLVFSNGVVWAVVGSGGGGSFTNIGTSGTLTKSGSALVLGQFGLLQQMTNQGSPTSIDNAYVDLLKVTDNQDSTGSTDPGRDGGFYIDYQFGATSKGGKQAFATNLTGIANADSGGTSRSYVGQTSYVQPVANGGTGTGTNSKGAWFGGNVNIKLASGTNEYIKSIIGWEDDIANGDSTTDSVIGHSIIFTSSHTQKAAVDNEGLVVAGGASIGSGNAGLDCGICIGNRTGFWPMASTGSVFSTWANNGNLGANTGAVTNLIYFPSISISGYAIDTPGFTLDGSGNEVANAVSAPQLTSTVATGTAPLVVASTTNVPNLNASLLGGATFSAPGAIGGGTAAAGTFTVLTGTSGSHTGLTGLGIRDTSAAFDVTLAATSSTNLSAGRTLTLDTKNVAHTLAFNATANTITFPNTSSYTLIGSGDSGTVTNTMLAGGITLANLASQATNTVVGNATSGSASPTALAVGGCSSSTSALIWTTNTGFGCNTSINAATLGGATFASPGAIGGSSAAAITGTTVTSTSTMTPGTYIVHGVTVLCTYGSATGHTHTGDQNETNLANCTVPANEMGTQGQLRITSLWTRTATTTNTVQFAIRYSGTQGSTSQGTAVVVNNATSGSVAGQLLEIIYATDATHQLTFGTIGTPFQGTSATANNALTVDTTAASYVNFSCKDTTSSSDTCGILGYSVELISP